MMEFASAGEFEIVRYVARQSLLSMSRNALEFWPEGFSLKSKFQNEMAREDWLGGVWWRIAQQAESGLDLILWDITDERFGVYSFHKQARVTRTPDIMGTLLEEVASKYEYLELGNAEHLRWWRWCVKLFAERLRELNLFEKVAVLRVPWASFTEEGKQVPVRVGLSPDEANKVYEPYYEALAQEGFRLLDLSDFPVYAEPLHQWGLAPYHYTLEVYEEMIRQVRGFVAELYPEQVSAPIEVESFVKQKSQRTVWSSPQDFLAEVDDPQGTYTIGFGDLQTQFSFNGHPSLSEQKIIPVFFSGAVMNRAKLTPPFFSGHGISRDLKTPYIAVSDPLVDADPQTNIAWYAGGAEDGFQRGLTDFFRGLIEKFDKQLLFIGGSAGGFSALYYGLSVGAGASVFAWNPQTDITAYIEDFARKYLATAGVPSEILAEPNWQAEAKKWCAGKIDLTLPSVTNLTDADRVLVLQNRSDWHLAGHMLPWLADKVPQHKHLNGSDAHIFDPDHLVVVGDFAEGHDTIPEQIIKVLLDTLINSDESLLDSLS